MMREKTRVLIGFLLCAGLVLSGTAVAEDQEKPILSALPGKIKTRIDPHANTVYYLGIKPKPQEDIP